MRYVKKRNEYGVLSRVGGVAQDWASGTLAFGGEQVLQMAVVVVVSPCCWGDIRVRALEWVLADPSLKFLRLFGFGVWSTVFRFLARWMTLKAPSAFTSSLHMWRFGVDMEGILS